MKPHPAAHCCHLVVVYDKTLQIIYFCFAFSPFSDRKAIFFNSHNVSKPESSSDLTTVAALVRIREYVRAGRWPLTHFVVALRERTSRECLSHPTTMWSGSCPGRCGRRWACPCLASTSSSTTRRVNMQWSTSTHSPVGLRPPAGQRGNCGLDLVLWVREHQCELTLRVLLVSGYEGVPEFFNELLNHITAVLQNHSPDLAGEQPKGLPLNTVPSAGPWIVDGEGGLKGSRQRLACNSTMSPNFQQHCVSTIATKASSQWLPRPTLPIWSLNKKKKQELRQWSQMIIIIIIIMMIIYLIKLFPISYWWWLGVDFFLSCLFVILFLSNET